MGFSKNNYNRKLVSDQYYYDAEEITMITINPEKLN